MANGGRIILGKDGKKIAAHHIDPHNPGNVSADQRKAAHGYELGAGEAFKALTPEQLMERSTEAKPADQQPAPAGAVVTNNK